MKHHDINYDDVNFARSQEINRVLSEKNNEVGQKSLEDLLNSEEFKNEYSEVEFDFKLEPNKDNTYTDFFKMIDDIKFYTMSGDKVLASDRPAELKLGFCSEKQDKVWYISVKDYKVSVDNCKDENKKKAVTLCFKSQEGKKMFVNFLNVK